MNPFSLFSLLSLLPSPTIQHYSINSTCEALSNDNPGIDHCFCTTSLQAAPASQCASLEGLGKIAIRLIHDNVTDTECHIKGLIERGGWDHYAEQCLNDCLELYSDAIMSAEEAMLRYKVGRFSDANVEISAIMTDVTTCEEGFKEGGEDSPLSKRNGDTFGISKIALAIMKELQPVHNE